jgi:hypothetical protein
LCDEKGENGVTSNQRAWWLFATWVAFGLGQLDGQILHATGPLPSFEVATVKPSNDDNAIPSVSTATESRTMNVTARNLIEQAYGIPWTPGRNERVVGGPAWIDNNRYDVDARIDQSLVARFEKLSHEERKQQMSLMTQSLLADRFKLKVHVESVELPIYALLFAKGGPKLTREGRLSYEGRGCPQGVSCFISGAGRRNDGKGSNVGRASALARGILRDWRAHGIEPDRASGTV